MTTEEQDQATNPSGIVWNKPASTKTSIISAQDGVVKEGCQNEKLCKKVAVVGFAESSRDLAPFDDPSWSIWGMNQLYRWIPRADRWFEFHTHITKIQTPGTNYLEWLKEAQIPIYMQCHKKDIPNSVTYPLDNVVSNLGGRYYFASTIGYMLALAIFEKFEEIAIYGVDLVDDSEWAYQKPNAEYYIGMAIERGIKITIPATSALLKQRWLYGYEEKPKDIFSKEDLEKRERLLMDAHEKLKTQTIAIEGALDECRSHKKVIIHRERGGFYEYQEEIED